MTTAPKAAAALFAYMLGFSLAYVSLPAATGTLILTASILLATMLAGRFLGESMGVKNLAGAALALGGVVVLLAPGLHAPPPLQAFFMGCAGLAWAIYTILGKHNADPVLATAGNFIRCLPFAAALLPFCREIPLDGVLYALASGMLASGLGYILWYSLLPRISTLTSALAQLSTPVLTALAAWALLGEAITPRLAVSGLMILAGIAYVQMHSKKDASSRRDGE